MSAKPHFLIIGAKRSGTSALFQYLVQHPKVVSPQYKELNYLYQRSFIPEQYLKLFPDAGITGEATPNYMIVEECAKRIKAINPEVKIILLAREPVSRILSEYPKQLARGMVSQPLEHLIAEEKKRLKMQTIESAMSDLDYFFNFKVTSYLLRGLYLPALKMWRQYFPEQQVMVIKSEDMFENAQEVLGTVFDFLDLHRVDHVPTPKVNSTSEWVKNTNIKYGCPPDLLKELAAFFEPHNQSLYEYLRRDLYWNAPSVFKGY